VIVRQGEKNKRKKKYKREKKRKKRKKTRREIRCILFMFFLLFLHEGRILIFIKNNIKNTKYILTVRSNSV